MYCCSVCTIHTLSFLISYTIPKISTTSYFLIPCQNIIIIIGIEMNGTRQTVQNFLVCATKLKVKHMSNNPRNMVYTNASFIIDIII